MPVSVGDNALSKLKKTLFGHAVGAVVIINLVLAGVALVKDILLAAYLGTSTQADAFWLAFFIPDMIGTLLTSSVGTACVPFLARLYVEGSHDRLKHIVSNLNLAFGLGSLLVFAILLFGRSNLIVLLGQGLDADRLDLCLKLYTIMLPAVLVFSFISIGSAVMQVYGSFKIPALAPVFFNMVIFGGLFFCISTRVPIEKGVFYLAWSFLGGAVAMALLMLAGIGREHIRIPVWPRRDYLIRALSDLKHISGVFWPYFTILLLPQLVFSFERHLASGLETGSVAGLNYAFRVSQFPIWVFVSAFGAVALPAMAKALGRSDNEELRAILYTTLEKTMVFVMPLAVTLYVLRVPVLTVLLHRGSFDEQSITVTAGILAGYALSIIFQGLSVICMRALLASGRTMNVLLACLFSTTVNIGLDSFLVGTMGSAGLGYGAAAAALVNCVLLLIIMSRRFTLIGRISLPSLIGIIAANLLLVPLLLLFNWFWEYSGASGAVLVGLGCTAIFVVIAVPYYLISLRLCGIKIFTISAQGEGE